MPLSELSGLKLSLTEEIQVIKLAYERLSVLTVNSVQYISAVCQSCGHKVHFKVFASQCCLKQSRHEENGAE